MVVTLTSNSSLASVSWLNTREGVQPQALLQTETTPPCLASHDGHPLKQGVISSLLLAASVSHLVTIERITNKAKSK